MSMRSTGAVDRGGLLGFDQHHVGQMSVVFMFTLPVLSLVDLAFRRRVWLGPTNW